VFTVAGLVQVVLFPIADGALGEVFVLGSTLPLAWRRTRPIEAALVSSAFWLIPLDGYPVLGFVVVILQFLRPRRPRRVRAGDGRRHGVGLRGVDRLHVARSGGPGGRHRWSAGRGRPGPGGRLVQHLRQPERQD
jgi:hypothetical protein